jgi:hypothetical protein
MVQTLRGEMVLGKDDNLQKSSKNGSNLKGKKVDPAALRGTTLLLQERI